MEYIFMHTFKRLNRILYTGTVSFEIINNVNMNLLLVQARIEAAFTRSEKKTQNTSYALLSQSPFWYKNIVVYPFCSPEKRSICCAFISGERVLMNFFFG